MEALEGLREDSFTGGWGGDYKCLGDTRQEEG